MSNNEGSFEAEFKLDPEDRLHPEHCKAKLKQIQDIGRHRHKQVRIEFPTTNGGTTSAIYTVSVFHPDEGSVILGHKIPNLNCNLNENKGKGVVKAQIMIEGLDDRKAEELGELVEHLSPNNQNRKLVVIAPHGGEIELGTDKQAEYVGNNLPSDRVSLWICKGFSRQVPPMHMNVGISPQLKLTRDRSPSLRRFLNRSLNIQLPFMGGRKILFVSEETLKALMLV
jgi:hypothetical protein